MRSFLITSAACAAVAGAVVLLAPRDARACGGCFHEPPSPMQTVPTVVTDHRMVFSVSQTGTTLYDQIRYQGDPSKFAWVLPITGNVEVGLSADVMFASLDALTRTVLTAPPPPVCAPPPNCFCSYRQGGLTCGFGASSDNSFGAASDAGAFADAQSPRPPGVEVTKHEVVGPYDTVQLKATDPMSITAWLLMNGFEIPKDVEPIIAAYQAEGFGFLALKLLPGNGVSSMRPVRVTTPGASLALPLRMVSAGTGANVGITLWIVGDGRYEPADFPYFQITDEELVWDWSAQSSNYAQLRQQKTQQSMGYGWEMESSVQMSRAQLEQFVLSGGTGSGFAPAVNDYDPIIDKMNPQNSKTPEEVRTADLDTLFGNMSVGRVTRARADLARAALGKDLHLAASADQSVYSNARTIKKAINEPPCPTYAPCPPCPSEGLGGGGGCSAAADGASEMGLLFVAGFVGLSIVRKRRRR